MTCAYAEQDGAYILGALSATERLEFEKHLPDCRDCSRSVRQLAGLPGLLAHAEPTALGVEVEEPAPDPILANLVRRVRRTRRRRILLAAGAAAAAAVLAGTLAVLWERDPAPAAAPKAPVTSAGQVMTPVGGAPVEATLALKPVVWGTRLYLACTYAPGGAWTDSSHAVTYQLFVRTSDGRTEQVGTWRSVADRTMRLTAATAARRDDIASVEVRTATGRPVLALAG